MGNVPPKENVKIELIYLQELSLSVNTFYQLHMTGTITPRYFNYIPQEQILYGYRNEEARVKGQFYWNFKITLKTSKRLVHFDSHTHPIALLSQNNEGTETVLVMEKAAVPNKDFSLSFTT